MRITVAHSYYTLRGGEDEVFEQECQLLEDRGHHVNRFSIRNEDFKDLSRLKQAKMTIWNKKMYRLFKQRLQSFKPDVVHLHNTFPFMSPSVIHAAKEENVPVVITLHNFRLFCSNGVLYRDGDVCEECIVKQSSLPAVKHGCYRGSKAASSVMSMMQYWHQRLETWHEVVDAMVAPSEMVKEKYVLAGFPEEKIAVIPHFMPIDELEEKEPQPYILYVGRLSEEKGTELLLKAWDQLDTDMTLKIIGEGPLEHLVKEAEEAGKNVSLIGRLTWLEMLNYIQHATALVAPSVCYETFGKVVMEALVCGVPAIVPEPSAMSEMIKHNKTGFTFRSGELQDLVAKLRSAVDNPKKIEKMRAAINKLDREKYTAESHYQQLRKVYETVHRSA